VVTSSLAPSLSNYSFYLSLSLAFYRVLAVVFLRLSSSTPRVSSLGSSSPSSWCTAPACGCIQE